MPVLQKWSETDRILFHCLFFYWQRLCEDFIRSQNRVLAARLSCPTFPKSVFIWKKLPPTLVTFVGTNPWKPCCTSIYDAAVEVDCEAVFLIRLFLFFALDPSSVTSTLYPALSEATEGWWKPRLGEGCGRIGALEAACGIFAYH